MSVLASPLATVLFQVAVTVSPSFNAPSTLSLHDALPISSVTTGACASTVALVLSNVGGLALPASSVAVSETLRLVASRAVAVIMYVAVQVLALLTAATALGPPDRKSTRLNSSHMSISYAVFCLLIQM